MSSTVTQLRSSPSQLSPLIESGVSIVLPTLNEEESIVQALTALNETLQDPCIVVVDGNSADRTAELAKSLGAHVISQTGKGKGDALRQAFNSSQLASRGSNIIVITDADCSMPPTEIPMLVKAVREGADLAKGSRFLAEGKSEDITLIRRIGNRFFLWIVNNFWGTKYTDLCYGFMAFRKEALEKLTPDLRSEGFEVETEICIKAKKLGLKVAEIPSIELRRLYGRSRLNTFEAGSRIMQTILREAIHKH